MLAFILALLLIPSGAAAFDLTIAIPDTAQVNFTTTCAKLKAATQSADRTTQEECASAMIKAQIELLVGQKNEEKAEADYHIRVEIDLVRLTVNYPNPMPEAICGDGNLDTGVGEECDDGTLNSDTLADACRITCLNAKCGDGVVDTGEACDDNEDCKQDCSGVR